MSPTDSALEGAATPIVSMRDLCAILVKHFGFHEGKYELGIEFQIGTGAVGPSQGDQVPGVIIGFHNVALRRTETDTATSVDAAEINPAKKASAKKVAGTRKALPAPK